MLSTLTLALALVSQCSGGACATGYGAYLPHPQYAQAQPALEPRTFRWQLTDAAHQTWTHNDPIWLQQFVTQRNAAIARRNAATRNTYPAYLPFRSNCAGGACR